MIRRIFISYTSSDRPFAIMLRARLQFHGAHVWIDISEMKAGDAIIRTLSDAISASNYFIILLSPKSVKSQWVLEELEQALTKQVSNDSRFVIPVVCKKCEIPNHLRKLKYVNLSTKTKFNEGFDLLLRSLDLVDDNAPLLVDPKRNSPDDFLTKAKDDKSFYKTVVNTPGAASLFSAVRFQMFGGKNGREIISLLSLFSHYDDGNSQHWFGLMTAMIFDTMSIADVPPPDAVKLISEIVSCQSIHTAYRSFAATLLLDMLQKTPDREFVLSAIPRIFPSHCHDPLADKAIAEFLGSPDYEKGSLLEGLWRIGSAAHRSKIESYVRRTSIWKTAPMESARVSGESLEDAWKKWKANWSCLWRDSSVREPFDLEVGRAIADKTVSMEVLIGTIERHCMATEGTETTDIVKFCVNLVNKFPKLEKSIGKAWKAHLLLNLLASPYIPQEVGVSSCMANGNIIQEVMPMDERFPNCLFRPKEVSWRTPKSFVGVCAEVAGSKDDMAEIAGLILLNIISIFDSDVTRVAVYDALSRPGTSSTATLVIKAIRSQISAHRASKILQDRVFRQEKGRARRKAARKRKKFNKK